MQKKYSSNIKKETIRELMKKNNVNQADVREGTHTDLKNDRDNSMNL